MAGLRGNTAWLAAAKQTGKGAAADPATATPLYKIPFAGGSIGPVRETDNLSETDSSRDRGVAYITTSGVEGSPEVYVRDDTIGFFIAHAFGVGSDSVVGATNYVHTLTPKNDLPYLTFWRDIGDVLYERFEDCQISTLTVSAEAGSPLSATVGIQGRKSTRLVSANTVTTGSHTLPAATINVDDATEFTATGNVSIGGQTVAYTGKTATTLTGATGGTGTFAAGTTVTQTAGAEVTALAGTAISSSSVYNFNEGAVTLGGSSTALIRSFEFTLENNVSRQQTDDVIPYDVVPGIREVSVGFDMIFENLKEYNKFHYGGATGTAISPSIFSTAATFTFTKGANNEVSFSFPSNLVYEELPVEPDAGGDPIVVSVRAVAQRATPIVTAVVKNQVATY